MPVQCPICSKPSRTRAENQVYPFCSERCRLVDLGRWLGEEYRVAATSPEEPPPDDRRSPEAEESEPL
jgi:endogenous inhibitor of DNA gyrase (YacG/DUF329 family)